MLRCGQRWDGDDTATQHIQQRHSERRVSRQAFRWPERRTGFDRRKHYRILGPLREHDWVLLCVLVAINVLSLADWFFTVHALGAGAIEGNPILATLISSSPLAAVAYKIGLTLAITLAIWVARRYRLILVTSVIALGVYVALIAYHLGGVVAIGG